MPVGTAPFRTAYPNMDGTRLSRSSNMQTDNIMAAPYNQQFNQPMNNMNNMNNYIQPYADFERLNRLPNSISPLSQPLQY